VVVESPEEFRVDYHTGIHEVEIVLTIFEPLEVHAKVARAMEWSRRLDWKQNRRESEVGSRAVTPAQAGVLHHEDGMADGSTRGLGQEGEWSEQTIWSVSKETSGLISGVTNLAAHASDVRDKNFGSPSCKV
jgi:hypothetical protein